MWLLGLRIYNANGDYYKLILVFIWQQDPDPLEQQNFFTDNSLKQDSDL